MNQAMLLFSLVIALIGQPSASQTLEQGCLDGTGVSCPLPGSSVLQVNAAQRNRRSAALEQFESAEQTGAEAQEAKADEEDYFYEADAEEAEQHLGEDVEGSSGVGADDDLDAEIEEGLRAAALVEEEQGEEEEAEEGEEVEAVEGADADAELEEYEFEGGRAEVHAGAQIFIHSDSEAVITGVGRWVVIIPNNCTTADVKKMTEHMPKGSNATFKGDPDAGGMCWFIMLGTHAMVLTELETHTWPSTPIVETDKRKSGFDPAAGENGKLLATQAGGVCTEDYYHPSEFESLYSGHVLDWTDTVEHLCASLSGVADEWIDQNKAGGVAGKVFSRMCKKGQPEKVLEPLAGLLRDPRFLCTGGPPSLVSSIEWLVLDDDRSGETNGTGPKSYFFDAGGSRFADALQYFLTAYRQRGILFDRAFVWEAAKQEPEAYWEGVPAEVRAFWEPRVLFYNGVPVEAAPGARDNPVDRIKELCKPEDFCAFKLDIDTPQVELPIVQQLLSNRAGVAASLDELFFEHHVHGLMQSNGWGTQVAGTYADSYDIFKRLRQLGIRAHSWI
uniref:Uncharacterized protein n=1 Tax=Alexandrium catenella TaxID=2925 RepID=A0A7S1WL49_ALECA|mmetsp:Transcript_71082/g.188996  ORF Transcript_71082/g.188996 Transcript_71082/m.188996 type:complete len:559 (+) Transcript_71082:119-1795(+)